jgi:hypothetical protein
MSLAKTIFFTSEPIRALISNSSRTTTLLVKQDMTLPENGGTHRLRKREQWTKISK